MGEYRLCFSKAAGLRYLSHLDLIKTIERALRRAGLALAHSEGFHPHPKFSFGPALAVGISSVAEYFDMELLEQLDPEEIATKLNRSLPQGIRIQAVKNCPGPVKSLNAVINRATYSMVVKVDSAARELLAQEFLQLLSRENLEVTRTNKNGQKVVNIRPWLHNLKVDIAEPDGLLLELTGEIGSNGNLRPEDLLQLVRVPFQILQVTRCKMWHEAEGTAVNPMDLC